MSSLLFRFVNSEMDAGGLAASNLGLVVWKELKIVKLCGLKFTIITIYLLITHEPSSCPGAHIFNCIYHN